MIKNCEYCTKEYKVKPSRAERSHYCSKDCHNKGQKGKHRTPMHICPQCDIEFKPTNKKQICCSKECHIREGRTILMAQCFIDIACIHRNQPVEFIDHYPLAEKACKYYMKDIITELLQSEQYKNTKFRITNTYLMIK